LEPSAVPKSYMMRLFWRGTRTASLSPPNSTYTNAVASDTVMWYQASPLSFAAAIASPDTNAASDSLYLEDVIFFTTSGQNRSAVITWAATGTLPASAVGFGIQILQVPNTYSFN